MSLCIACINAAASWQAVICLNEDFVWFKQFAKYYLDHFLRNVFKKDCWNV
jgi:hypothetical protein